MRTIRMVVLALFLTSFGAVIVHAQAPNSCVYPYSFVSPLGDSFAFCLTAYGTLASLQNPIGNEHLDPNNPLEGFSVYDTSGSIPLNLYIYPGFNTSQGPPSVKQPNGPGKLPIVFTYTYGDSKYGQVTSTVTVPPSDKTVVFTMKVGKYVFQKYTSGIGPIFRNVGLLVDGSGSNIFANSGFAGFSYNPTGHGVMISGFFCERGNCGETSGSVQAAYGQNGVQEQGFFDTTRVSTAVFSYKVF